MRRLRALALPAVPLAVAALAAIAVPVRAHAIGEAFQLPVPSWLYLAGSGTAVAASFVVAGLVVRVGTEVPRYPRLRLPAFPSQVVSGLLAVAGLVWWYGAIAAALLIGRDTALPAVLFWVFTWAGLPIVAALLGNPWPSLSPFRSTFAILQAIARFFGLDRLDLGLPYPAGLARWPAVLLLFCGLSAELVLPTTTEPPTVVALLVGYTAVTEIGIICFGRTAWLRNAELFEVLLGWFGRVGPLGRRSVSANACAGCGEQCLPDRCVDCPECATAAIARERRPEVRPWFAGLTDVRRGGWSDAAFILLALAGVTYDGMRETSLWVNASNWFFPFVYPALSAYRASLVTSLAGLAAVWVSFGFVFVIGAFLTRMLSERARARAGLGSLVGSYAATLLPIAAGYMLAHYLTLVIQGAAWMPQLIRDPRSQAPTLANIPASAVWYLSVGAIVVGHVAAIFLAHRLALRDAPDHPLRAGLPLATLMVGYTILSLWIIAEPIVVEPGEQRPAATVERPASAAAPARYELRRLT
jgi:hypothetical protein